MLILYCRVPDEIGVHQAKLQGKRMDVRSWECGVCLKIVSSKRNLRTHLLVHSAKKPHTCILCDKTFTRKAHMVRHSQIHTNERPYQCWLCPAAFGSATSLRRRVFAHTGQRPHQCSICGRRFASRAPHVHSLRREALRLPPVRQEIFSESKRRATHFTHTDERPYMCYLCPAAFRRNSTLREHVLTHTGEKPYVCEQCGNRFARKTSLVKHSQLHSV